jgi:hypothetical protein
MISEQLGFHEVVHGGAGKLHRGGNQVSGAGKGCASERRGLGGWEAAARLGSGGMAGVAAQSWEEEKGIEGK